MNEVTQGSVQASEAGVFSDSWALNTMKATPLYGKTVAKTNKYWRQFAFLVKKSR